MNQKLFFAQKLHDLALVLNKQMQLMCVTDGQSQYIFSDSERGPRGGPPASGRFLRFFSKRIETFNAVFITFCTF